MSFASDIGIRSVFSLDDDDSNNSSTDATSTSNIDSNNDVSSLYDDSSIISKDFFEKAEEVIFNFSDFCFVSGYVLFLMIWGESYIQSRRHWFSQSAFRKVWFHIYIVINIVIFGSQVGLYSLLFVPTFDKRSLSEVIFISLAAFNLLLPFLWIIFYIVLYIKFTGFPFATIAAKERLSNIFTLGIIWTLARVGYGVCTLTSFIEDYTSSFNLANLKSLYFMAIFLCFEIFPILVTLSFVASLSSNCSIKATVHEQQLNFQTPMNKTNSNIRYAYATSTSGDLELHPLLNTTTKRRLFEDIQAAIKAGVDVRSALYGSILSPLQGGGGGVSSDDDSVYNKTIEFDELDACDDQETNSLTSTLSGSFKSLEQQLGGETLASSSLDSLQSEGYFSCNSKE